MISRGHKWQPVVNWQEELIRVGFPIRVTGVFCVVTEACTKAFQMDHGIKPDGVVGPVTSGKASSAPSVSVSEPDTTKRAQRLSVALGRLWDHERFRMRPEYRSSSIGAWQGMEAGKRAEYVIPMDSRGRGVPSATCGHTAWLLAEWYYRGLGLFDMVGPTVLDDSPCTTKTVTRTPTWRTGRGGKLDGHARFLPLLPADGKMLAGKLHRGLSEYVTATVETDDLASLYHNAPHPTLGDWYICERASGHIVTVIVARKGNGFADPRTMLPARMGAYVLEATNRDSGTGQPWSFRRIEKGWNGNHGGPWKCWEFARLNEDGTPDGGPCAWHPDLPLTMETA